MSDLQGRVALISGSTRGVGECTARMFAAKGAAVVVTGRNRKRGEAVAASIESSGGKTLYVAADFGVEDDVRAVVEAATERFGRLDVLVNNAAPTDVMAEQTRKDVVGVASEEFDRVMRVGLYGAVWACKYSIPHMQRAGGGSIINISSLAAVEGLPGLAAYTCAKGALGALTRQVAVDFGADDIRVNTLLLGFISNELTQDLAADPGLSDAMHRMHLTTRFGRNEDVARMCVYLGSDDGSFLTGTEIRLDGGSSAKGDFIGDMVEIGVVAR